MKEQQKRNPKDRQHETLRLGTPESSMAEKVKEVTFDQAALQRARKALYASTGEASRLPNLDDAAKERAITATGRDSKSSKKK